MSKKPIHPGSDAPRWSVLTAADIMQTRIITVADTAPLSEVERVLTENRITGVPVTDQAGRVVGVISVRDLLDRYVEEPDSRPRRGKGYYHESTEEMADEDLESGIQRRHALVTGRGGHLARARQLGRRRPLTARRGRCGEGQERHGEEGAAARVGGSDIVCSQHRQER